MTGKLCIEPHPVPLYEDATDRWRVNGTRISLELIVECYKEGMTPEGIVEDYDTLRLADVYAVVSYYLDHKEDIEKYMAFWEARAQEVERMIKEKMPLRPGLKEEIRARWAHREAKNASSGH